MSDPRAGPIVADPVGTMTCIYCAHDGTHSDDTPCMKVIGDCRCPQCAGLSRPVYAELCMCPGEDGQ